MSAKLLFLNQLSKLATFMPMELLIKLSGRKFIAPFYHVISDEYVPHIHHLYKIRNIKLFRQDLDFLLKHYKPISLEDLYKNIENGNENKSKTFFLSFDDGLSEIYNIVAPVLKEKGIPAAIFINPDFIDNKDLFFRYKASLLVDHIQNKKNLNTTLINKLLKIWPGTNTSAKNLKKTILNIDYQHKEILYSAAEVLEFDFNEYLRIKKPYLTTDQINDLQKSGFSIGAHSMDHPIYNTITLKDQLIQTKKSIEFVKENFNPAISSFAFPFTDFGVTSVFFDNIFNTENKIVDITFGTAGIKLERNIPFHIHRIPMEINLNKAQEIIAAEYAYFLLKKPLNKNVIIRNS